MSRTEGLDMKGFATTLDQNVLRAAKGVHAARAGLGEIAGEGAFSATPNGPASLHEDFPGKRTLQAIDQLTARESADLANTNHTVLGMIVDASRRGTEALVAAKDSAAATVHAMPVSSLPAGLDAQLAKFQADLGADHPWTPPERRTEIANRVGAMKGALTVLSSYRRGAYAAAAGYMAHLSTDPASLAGMEPGRSFAALVRTGESIGAGRASAGRVQTRETVVSLAAHRARSAVSQGAGGPDL